MMLRTMTHRDDAPRNNKLPVVTPLNHRACHGKLQTPDKAGFQESRLRRAGSTSLAPLHAGEQISIHRVHHSAIRST